MSTRKVSDLLLERLSLGELTRQEEADVLERLKDEPDRLDALKESNRQILQEHDPRLVAGEVYRRVHLIETEERDRARRYRKRTIWTIVPAAAAALAIFAVVPPKSPIINPEVVIEEGVRAKGLEPSLKVYRQVGESKEELESGTLVKEQDLIQLSYIAAGFSYGIIISIDGSGSVTLHHPSNAGGTTRLSNAGETGLSFSYELDNAPEFERFFLVASNNDLDVHTVLDAGYDLVKQGRARDGLLEIEDKVYQTSITLQKGEK